MICSKADVTQLKFHPLNANTESLAAIQQKLFKGLPAPPRAPMEQPISAVSGGVKYNIGLLPQLLVLRRYAGEE